MQITLDTGTNGRHKAAFPYDGATHVIVHVACPHGCERKVVLGIALPLKVSGAGIERRTHDTYYAPAVALCCKRRVGTLETQVSTVFGVDEDERVLGGPWRVY